MDWRFNTLWCDQLPQGIFKSVDFGNESKSPCDLAGVSYVWASRFKSKTGSLDDFPAEKAVEYLELSRANITSFAGLSRFEGIKSMNISGREWKEPR